MWAALVLALLKAFPCLRDIFNKAVEMERAGNEAEAIKRHADKDASVNVRIDSLRVLAPPAEQLGKVDEPERFQTGSAGGS